MNNRIAIIVVGWNGERFLPGCLASIRSLNIKGIDEVHTFLVENASADRTIEIVSRDYPEVELLPQTANIGFSDGCNLGIQAAMEKGFDFVYLLNQDAAMDCNALEEAVAVAQAYPDAGVIQSLVLIEQQPSLVNTWGNPIHFFGFGYLCGLNRPIDDMGRMHGYEPKEIASFSGAASLLRVSALRQTGIFDGSFFTYNEDVDLSWRMWLCRHKILIAPVSRVFHHYEFERNAKKMYYIERNRWFTLLKNYHVLTLLLLAPALALFEVYMFFYSLVAGWLPWKVLSWKEVILSFRELLAKRRDVQRMRRVRDRDVIFRFSSTLRLGDHDTLLIKLGNRFLRLYWQLALRIVFW